MSYCFICHRELGDSYDLMWASGYTKKLVPVCSEDRECREMGKKRSRPEGRPQVNRKTNFDSASIAQKEGKDNV
ncbi:MAG: hypothetical protein MJZ99_06985 [Bacteroidales bacterium]|nr:hypothetical protein [Bacteroidales bacterium]